MRVGVKWLLLQYCLRTEHTNGRKTLFRKTMKSLNYLPADFPYVPLCQNAVCRMPTCRIMPTSCPHVESVLQIYLTVSPPDMLPRYSHLSLTGGPGLYGSGPLNLTQENWNFVLNSA